METHAILFSFAVGIVIVGLVFFKLWPEARRARFQQDLFKIRNDLFLYMAENRHSFDTPAYRSLRRVLNSAIRYAESVDIASVFIMSVTMRDPDATVEKEIEQIESDELREHLKTAYMQTGLRIFKFLSCNLVGGVGFLLLLVYRAFRYGFKASMNGPQRLDTSRPVRAYIRQSHSRNFNGRPQGPAVALR